MLKKMGWEEGDGLGRNKHGEVDPLTLDIKFDKKGLTAAEEEKGGRGVSLLFFKDSRILSLILVVLLNNCFFFLTLPLWIHSNQY